jgi:hypothetical protein
MLDQNTIAQALGAQAAGGQIPAPMQPMAPVQGGMPFQPGVPGQTPIDPMMIAAALGQPQVPVNPAPPSGNTADPLAGPGSILDYLRRMREWKNNGMVGPQPQPPGAQPDPNAPQGSPAGPQGV